jgi:hypothetical protein
MSNTGGPLSFATDIRPMFKDVDVRHMQPHGFDLSSYVDVKLKAQAIYKAVSSRSMPPNPDDAWSQPMCAMFKDWIDQGCPQ